jgi:hypothetical protein
VSPVNPGTAVELHQLVPAQPESQKHARMVGDGIETGAPPSEGSTWKQ